MHKLESIGLSDPVEGLSEIALARREQILDAAEAIITGHGIQKLSLGQIEDRAGMSRGQLTYYFPTKESILLAVYDRMLKRMIREAMAADGPKPMTGVAWEYIQHGLQKHLGPDWPPPGVKDLFSLLFTFLAQMGHRNDYRTRLSQWYAEWRTFLAADIGGSVPEPVAAPRVVAALIQALFHGLDVQLMMDPNAFDRQEMFAACVRLLAPLFGRASETPAPSNGYDESHSAQHRAARNGERVAGTANETPPIPARPE
jgi:AcrR family transcriptional regulator